MAKNLCRSSSQKNESIAEDSQIASSVDADLLHKQNRPVGGRKDASSLARRLCSSCSQLTLADISPGKTLHFDAAALPNRLGCNLCQLFRVRHLEYRKERLVEKRNTILQKTTPAHAIRVEILEILVQRSDLVVTKSCISDTWFGDPLSECIFFRDWRFVNSSARESKSNLGFADGLFSKWADLARARLWVHECVHGHRNCQSIVSGTPESGSLHTTTRFIDVRRRRLVQIDEIFPAAPLEYVALSYVWGRDYQLRTLSGNLDAFRRRLPTGDARPGERIPRTIEDAMLVTQALGYRFLWVDALCIVQDSEHDLNLQLAQMGAIYGLAILCIAARGSCSSDSGLPGISAPRSCVSYQTDVEVMVNEEAGVGVWDMENKSITEEFEEMQGKLANAQCYIRRGWTLQEQILSTRVIEFNLHRLGFWCRKEVPCLERGYPHAATPGLYDTHYFRHVMGEDRDREGLLGWWCAIRSTYSMRCLTHYVDRSRAIRGSAAAMGKIIGGIDEDGVVRSNIHKELLWYLDLQKEVTGGLRASADKAPKGLFSSWSWLSVWPVGWLAMCQGLEDVSIRILNDLDSTSNAVLEIESPMLELRLAEDFKGTKILAFPDGTTASIKLRLDSPLENGLEVFCVPLARGIWSIWGECELLLLRRQGRHYTRIGIGSLPESESDGFNSALKSESGQRRRILCL
ncbi:HET-domain-containing protein [Nemania abortiva]|nr:HET-domain-containing protein [Nemania abortiva]